MAKYKSDLKEAAAFCVYFLKKFFESLKIHNENFQKELAERKDNEEQGMDVSNQNPNFMFPIDLLFWKNSQVLVHDIETGDKSVFTKLSNGGKNSTNVAWSENDNEILKKACSEIEQDPDCDWVFRVMQKIYRNNNSVQESLSSSDDSDSDNENSNSNLKKMDGDYNRKQVTYQMLKLGICSSEDLKAIKVQLKTHIWKDTEINELKILFEEFYSKKIAYENGESDEKIDVAKEIRENMSAQKKIAKHVIVSKLLDLKLIEDKNKLKYRRAPRKSGASNSRTENSGRFKSRAQIFSEDDISSKSEMSNSSSSSSDTDDENDFQPGVIANENRIQYFAKSISETFIKFLVTELELNLENEKNEPDNDDPEEYVILANSEETGKILNKKSNHKFICSLGFQKPDLQHSNWRVPVVLNKNKVIRILKDILENSKNDTQEKDALVNSAIDQIRTEDDKRRARRKQREKESKEKGNNLGEQLDKILSEEEKQASISSSSDDEDMLVTQKKNKKPDLSNKSEALSKIQEALSSDNSEDLDTSTLKTCDEAEAPEIPIQMSKKRQRKKKDTTISSSSSTSSSESESIPKSKRRKVQLSDDDELSGDGNTGSGKNDIVESSSDEKMILKGSDDDSEKEETSKKKTRNVISSSEEES